MNEEVGTSTYGKNIKGKVKKYVFVLNYGIDSGDGIFLSIHI